MRCARTMRFGATLNDGAAVFRLWAPTARGVELLWHRPAAPTRPIPAARRADGWYEVRVADAQAGQRYQWRIDGERVVPDPASRWNPQGPEGPSVLVNPLDFEWDENWRGRPWHEAVFYQLHIGTWTEEGTFAAAIDRLPALAALGVTALQLMPVADFPGGFGWGYDGVLPFAPYHAYGPPNELKQFVQSAHRLGLMVFADVVYNHFGPRGNHLQAYAAPFFTSRHATAWGEAIDFASDTVRSFFIDNALYWLHEFQLDGLRLDAVHAIRDERRPDFLEELSERVRKLFRGRHVHLVIENDANDPTRLAAPGTPGRYDAQWNGDLHHCLHVLLTGERDGYYAEYDEPLQQAARCLRSGFARQGGPHNVAGAAPRGPAEGEVPLGALVQFLQNHDQIGNRPFGERLAKLNSLSGPEALRLVRAILLLMPSVPLLFMGEEFGARTPFLYFADWDGELAEAVRSGRHAELAQAMGARADAQAAPDPCSRETFERCKLGTPATTPGGAAVQAAYAELLALRAKELVPWMPQLAPQGHGATLRGTLVILRWRFHGLSAGEPERWLQMQANLGAWATATESPGPDAQLLHAVGERSGSVLGPWSGRWHWLPAEAA